MIIPLNSGSSYQRFTATLSGKKIRFELRWLARFSVFLVDLYDSDQPLVFGRALHPGQNLLDGVITDLGSITLTGSPPTLQNLGKENQLEYTP